MVPVSCKFIKFLAAERCQQEKRKQDRTPYKRVTFPLLQLMMVGGHDSVTLKRGHVVALQPEEEKKKKCEKKILLFFSWSSQPNHTETVKHGHERSVLHLDERLRQGTAEDSEQVLKRMHHR